MTGPEADAAAELLERLLTDPVLRKRFRSDPVAASREAGVESLAEEMSLAAGKAMQTLDGRESRSSLAGVFMAAALEGAAAADVIGDLVPHLEEIPESVGKVLSRIDLPAVPGLQVDTAQAAEPPRNSAGEFRAVPDPQGGRATAHVDPADYGQQGTGGSPSPEATQLLDNKRVTLDANGIADLKAGKIDPRIPSVLGLIARHHTLTVSAMMSDHNMQTSGGSVSNHYYGRAVDIASIDGQPVGPGNQLAKQIAISLSRLPASIRPTEIGSPWALPGAAYFTDAEHQNHLHVGFDDPIARSWKPPEEVAATETPADAVETPQAPVASQAFGDEADDGGGDDEDADDEGEDDEGDDEDGSEEPGGLEDPGGDTDAEADDESDGDEDDDSVSDDASDEEEDDEESGDDSDDGDSGDSEDSGDSDDSGDLDDSGDSADGGDSDDSGDGTSGDSGGDAAGGGFGGDPGIELGGVDGAYPGDDAPQADIAAWMGAQAQKHGLPPELPVMAGLVESGLRNLSGGDADSAGFFQMRVGIWNQGEYAGYTDKPELQLKWFIDHALAEKRERVASGQPVDDPGSYGDWIADVERPAAQYRGRYQLRLDEARSLLKEGMGHRRSDGGGDGAAELVGSDGGRGAGPRALAAVAEARKYLGTPYRWGGSSPKTGFDCSGLMQWAYAKAGIRIPRVSEQQILASNGRPVDRRHLMPGDLVFFRDSSGDVHHVGMSLGGDRFIHAPHTGDVVKISSLKESYYAQQFTGGRRFDVSAASQAHRAAAQAVVARAAGAEARSLPAVNPDAVREAEAALARDAAEAQRPGTLLFEAVRAEEARKARVAAGG